MLKGLPPSIFIITDRQEASVYELNNFRRLVVELICRLRAAPLGHTWKEYDTEGVDDDEEYNNNNNNNNDDDDGDGGDDDNGDDDNGDGDNGDGDDGDNDTDDDVTIDDDNEDRDKNYTPEQQKVNSAEGRSAHKAAPTTMQGVSPHRNRAARSVRRHRHRQRRRRPYRYRSLTYAMYNLFGSSMYVILIGGVVMQKVAKTMQFFVKTGPEEYELQAAHLVCVDDIAEGKFGVLTEEARAAQATDGTVGLSGLGKYLSSTSNKPVQTDCVFIRVVTESGQGWLEDISRNDRKITGCKGMNDRDLMQDLLDAGERVPLLKKGFKAGFTRVLLADVGQVADHLTADEFRALFLGACRRFLEVKG